MNSPREQIDIGTVGSTPFIFCVLLSLALSFVVLPLHILPSTSRRMHVVLWYVAALEVFFGAIAPALASVRGKQRTLAGAWRLCFIAGSAVFAFFGSVVFCSHHAPCPHHSHTAPTTTAHTSGRVEPPPP